MSTYRLAPSSSRIRTAALLTPGLLLLGSVPVWAHHSEKHFKVDSHPIVTIHNPTGTITIKAWTKQEVMVMADHNSDAVEILAEQTGNRIDIMSNETSGAATPDDIRADYQVNVPQDAELQIHDDSGSVSVANVSGDMNVETIEAGV